MTDYISRQAAIDAIKEEIRMNSLALESDLPYKTRIILNQRNGQAKDDIDIIKNLPAAQPKRAKGHWIPVDSYSAFGGDEATWMAHGNPIAYHYCSNCKQQARADEEGKDILSDFCPDCGADMRGKEDG